MSAILIQSVEYQGDVDTVANLAMAIGSVAEEIENDLPPFLEKQLEKGKYGRLFIKKLDLQLMRLVKNKPIENSTKMKYNKIQDALLGVAVGDALGVPFEFCTSDQMKKNPAK